MPKKTVKKTIVKKEWSLLKRKKTILLKIWGGFVLVVFLLSALLLGNIFGNKFFSNKIVNITPSDTTKANSNQTQQNSPTDSTVDAKLKKLFSNSVETNIIEIKNCKTTPTVAKIALSKDFEIQNKDSNKHTLVIFNKSYEIQAGGKISIKADFGKGVGFYGIQCDGVESGYINIP